MKRVCVYCGSSMGNREEYRLAAQSLGNELLKRGLGLVYGAGNIGLMGVLADCVLEGGGEVIGVIPQFLMDKEVGHKGLTELMIVNTMHERKARMESLSDAFIALPGGLGTMDELFEIWTWGQLGVHGKPCGLLNVAGYFDPLVTFLDHMVVEKFVDPRHRQILCLDSKPDFLLDRLLSRRLSPVKKWLDSEQL